MLFELPSLVHLQLEHQGPKFAGRIAGSIAGGVGVLAFDVAIGRHDAIAFPHPLDYMGGNEPLPDVDGVRLFRGLQAGSQMRPNVACLPAPRADSRVRTREEQHDAEDQAQDERNISEHAEDDQHNSD